MCSPKKWSMRLSPSNVYKSSRELAENQYHLAAKTSSKFHGQHLDCTELRIGCKFIRAFLFATSIRLTYFSPKQHPRGHENALPVHAWQSCVRKGGLFTWRRGEQCRPSALRARPELFAIRQGCAFVPSEEKPVRWLSYRLRLEGFLESCQLGLRPPLTLAESNESWETKHSLWVSLWIWLLKCRQTTEISALPRKAT
jgi:hypothetical protein